MDFMKVLDQTVRDIKREVNLKVLKVPEIEQKVLDATSDEPWGPHGSDLADIARATKKFGECEMIMNVLWQRLGDTAANWRHVYKALAVIEYLLANGSERAVDDILDNSSQIAKLSGFKCVEANGKDVGINVRKKAESAIAILDDKEKLQQVREKAAATRDKYFGLSSTGIAYKSSTASFGSGSYSSGDHYGSMGNSSQSNRETNSNYSGSNLRSKEANNDATSYKLMKGAARNRRNQHSSTTNLKPSPAPGASSAQKGGVEDDDDDFNPRGSSASGLLGDLVDIPASTPTVMPSAATADVPEIDLFADASFQLANAAVESTTGSHAQDNVDLFAGRSSFVGSFTSDTAFSVRGSPKKSSEQKLPAPDQPTSSAIDSSQPSFAASFPSDTEFPVRDSQSKSSQELPSAEHASTAAFDPFAAIPLNSFGGSDPFGAFSSSTGLAVAEPSHSSPAGMKSSDHSPSEELNFGAFTSSHMESPTAATTESVNKSPTKMEQASRSASSPAAKKEAFQVKSGIWADSLSRGLIDLNISASKKVNLKDIGIVGQLSDGSEEEKGPAAPWYMGAAMGLGSDLGRSGFPSSTGTAGGSGNFQQQRFGNFK